jgi:putative FmdB family regulatory protein
MPYYEYKCKQCGKCFEIVQRITEEALTKCPPQECDEKERGEVQRIISKTSFSLKGGGWYKDGY